jgi:hypothetical protein
MVLMVFRTVIYTCEAFPLGTGNRLAWVIKLHDNRERPVFGSIAVRVATEAVSGNNEKIPTSILD